MATARFGWVLAGVVVVGVAVALLVRRPPAEERSGARPPASRPATQPANPEAVAKAMQAVDAQLARQFTAARKLYEEALALQPGYPGAEYQLAVACFQMRDLLAARTHAQRSVDLGQEVPAAHNLLGILLATAGQHDQAQQQFRMATEAAPADPQGFFNWSESLREQGRPADAIPKLRAAIQRNPREPLYAFKLRMATIESGQEAELVDETREQLKLNPPAGDWLLTAAAISLRRQNYAEAANMLAAARERMDPVLYLGMVEDHAFLAHAKHPQIAPFYAVTVREQRDGQMVDVSATRPASAPAGVASQPGTN